MFANKPEMAEKWAKHTPEGAKLPERVKAPEKKRSGGRIAVPKRFKL